MADYEETKRKLLRQHAFGILKGIPLDRHCKRKGWKPIVPCIDFGDDDDFPCENLDDIIVWIPSDATSVKTGKRCKGGEIFIYNVSRDTRVLVETQLPMTVGQLHKAKRLAEAGPRQINAFLPNASVRDGPASVRTLLTLAFELGWHIGETIEQRIGLTDRISEWFANKFSWSRRTERSRPAGTTPVVHVHQGGDS